MLVRLCGSRLARRGSAPGVAGAVRAMAPASLPGAGGVWIWAPRGCPCRPRPIGCRVLSMGWWLRWRPGRGRGRGSSWRLRTPQRGWSVMPRCPWSGCGSRGAWCPAWATTALDEVRRALASGPRRTGRTEHTASIKHTRWALLKTPEIAECRSTHHTGCHPGYQWTALPGLPAQKQLRVIIPHRHGRPHPGRTLANHCPDDHENPPTKTSGEPSDS